MATLVPYLHNLLFMIAQWNIDELTVTDRTLFNIIYKERILHSNINIYGFSNLKEKFHHHCKNWVLSHHFGYAEM